MWNPASAVGFFYTRMAEDVVPLLDTPTGFRLPGDDSVQIDPEQFRLFVIALVDRYQGANHRVLRDLLGGFVRTTLGLAINAGIEVPDASAELLADGRSRVQEMPR
ncbi:DUF6086 family protein [Kribbella sp. NPDC051770]|uniref:DUF6086 family protein n=1 Tax=Kribbella sp. NPDC051770 TaxID=3155413 RepID=UPI00341F0825